MSNTGIGLGLAIIPLVMFAIAMLAALALYALRSFGLYCMAKNTGMGNPWLAWVPVAHEYLAGKMADRFTATKGRKTRLGFWSVFFLGLALCVLAALFIDLFASVFAAAFSAGSGASNSGMQGTVVAAMMTSLIGFYVAYFAAIIASRVFQCIALYYLYSDFEPDQKVLHTVLGVFGLDWISKLMLRNNVPVGIAGYRPAGQPKYNC